MLPILISGGLRSNWQFVVFYLIENHVTEKYRKFLSSDIIRNAEEIYPLLAIRGHKEKPKNPERILHKTLQNMRDKKPPWITFLDYRGEYELTGEGYKVLLSVQKQIRYIRKNKAELLKEAEDYEKEFV